MRTLEYLECPECGVPRPLAFRGGNLQTLHFVCPECLPGPLTLGRHIPGLPSDLTFLRRHGKRLVAEAYEELRDEIRARREACARANRLLREHLTEEQWSELEEELSFHIPSRSSELIYLIRYSSPHKVNVAATTRGEGGSVDDFARGMSRLPQLGEAIRLKAVEQFRMNLSVPLCLNVSGPLLPLADQALAFKLFLEANEVRAWIKGMRGHLGLQPENMAFSNTAAVWAR